MQTVDDVARTIVPAGGQLELYRTALGDIGEGPLRDWKRFDEQSAPASSLQDPDWLQGYFSNELGAVSCYLLYGPAGLCGTASFLSKSWPLSLHLGEIKIAELPLRRLRFLGGSLTYAEDASVFDVLFSALTAESTGYDALHFSEVSVESFLWKYLHTSPVVKDVFYPYSPGEPARHPLLRLPASFDEYMKQFSKTHRHHLKRKVRRFQEEAPGKMRFVRYTRPDEVLPFLDAAVELSKKTYQWKLHGRGLSQVDLLKQRYVFAAGRSWFRSYILFLDDTPCAFLSGYQWKGKYYTDEIGFDPALARFSPGTVLQVLWIEDLFSFDRPELVDFGGYGEYKESFSTESYLCGDVMLLPHRVYSRLVQVGDSACRLANRTAARLLGSLQLKARLKKFMRGWSGQPDKDAAK